MHLICIADVLTAADAADLRRALADLPRRDGRQTAGWAAREAKRNQQFDGAHPALAPLRARVNDALARHALLAMYARPQRLSSPLFSAYREDMEYGRHSDDALMGDPALRTDLSYTLFLADPDAYDGGELVIEGTHGETPVKLPAGAAVVYAGGALHRVNPVTRGERIAAVGWIQSRIREPERRELLFDLERTRRALHERGDVGEESLVLGRCVSSLLRMWADA